MATFLISIPIVNYGDYICAKEGIPNTMGSTVIEPELVTLYIEADSEPAALDWAKHIGDRYSTIIEDVPDWKERNLMPFVERDPVAAGLTGLDSFLQKVRVGEEPRYEDLTGHAFVQWMEENWRET